MTFYKSFLISNKVVATQASEAIMLEGACRTLPSAIASERNGEEYLTNLHLAPQLLEHRTQGRERQQHRHLTRTGMAWWNYPQQGPPRVS